MCQTQGSGIFTGESNGRADDAPVQFGGLMRAGDARAKALNERRTAASGGAPMSTDEFVAAARRLLS